MPSQLDSALGEYLGQIKDFPLLTPDEEQELGAAIQAARDAEVQVAQREITIAEYERLQDSAAIARERMISANLRLVISVAKKYRNRGLPMEDLIEEGNLGLVNAVDRFDPTVGSRFSTYGSYWIDQAIRRAVQRATQIIHIPSYLVEHIVQMKLTRRELEQELGRAPSLSEVAARMEISPRKARAIAQAIRAASCPNQLSSDDDGNAVAESLPDTRTPQPQDALFDKAESEFVHGMLDRISEREALVLQLRYGLNGHAGRKMTLKEIGEEVGLTRERVRQIEKEARSKLEQFFRDAI